MIFNPLWDLKVILRTNAVHALRAGLIVTVQRETAKQGKHHHIAWYKGCYNAVRQGFNQIEEIAAVRPCSSNSTSTPAKEAPVREARVHGSLLVLSELLG